MTTKSRMSRKEWYESTAFLKARLLNNLCAEIGQTVQEALDVLKIIDAEHGPLVGNDKFLLVERQLRVVGLGSDEMWRAVREFCSFVESNSIEEEEPCTMRSV